MPPETILMMKTNSDYVLLLSNMSAYNIKPLVKEFNLTRNDIRRLKAKGKGKGLLIVGDTRINYFNSLTPDDERVIFGKSLKVDSENTEQSAGFCLIKGTVGKDKHKVFLKTEHRHTFKPGYTGTRLRNGAIRPSIQGRKKDGLC